MVKIALKFWDRLGWVMKGGKLYKVECGEKAAVKGTFQRRICHLLKAVVLFGGEKHDKTKLGDLLEKKPPKNNCKDIKM